MKTGKQLNKRQIEVRNEILCYGWENYKNRVSMQELTEMFENISLDSGYKIIRKGSVKVK